MKELKFEELTLDQKFGLVHTIKLNGGITEEDIEFIFDRIKAHAVGAVWMQHGAWMVDVYLKRVLETADYPILIMTDAEKGMEGYEVGGHNPIACTGDEKYAYAFGKSVGFAARKLGYNVVCNPVLDLSQSGSVRSFGSDPKLVAKMAAAEIKGMHDAGVLSVAKHYPSARDDLMIDSHMAEAFSAQTKEELLEYSLYAYRELMSKDLLDGVMTSHCKLPNIDDEYPASLSKKVIDVIRDEGFEGFCMTDALNMMGIRAKFGEAESIGLAVAAGNDLPMPFTHAPQKEYNAIKDAYEKGVITDEQLDACVKRVLAAQHKVMELDKNRSLELDKEVEKLALDIQRAAVCARVDEGLTPSISKDGKHLFALMVRNEVDLSKPDVDTFTSSWLSPVKVIEMLQEAFPNSGVTTFHEFPTGQQNYEIFQGSLKYDDVIFLTFSENIPYAGDEALTTRVVSLIKALQYTNRVSALIHFGNPCVLEALPHIPRVIIGGITKDGPTTCIDALAGKYTPTGKLTCEVDFK